MVMIDQYKLLITIRKKDNTFSKNK